MNIFEDAFASNAFAIHGKLTVSGNPILASDPHLGASIPSAWYLIGLHAEDGNYAVGNSLPGVPHVTTGKTNDFVFGITANLVDVSDLYREKLNPEKT